MGGIEYFEEHLKTIGSVKTGKNPVFLFILDFAAI